MQIIHEVGQLIACQEPAHASLQLVCKVEGAPNSVGALRAPASLAHFQVSWTFFPLVVGPGLPRHGDR